MLVAACKINSVKDYKQISPANNKLKSREKRKEGICVIKLQKQVRKERKEN